MRKVMFGGGNLKPFHFFRNFHPEKFLGKNDSIWLAIVFCQNGWEKPPQQKDESQV